MSRKYVVIDIFDIPRGKVLIVNDLDVDLRADDEIQAINPSGMEMDGRVLDIDLVMSCNSGQHERRATGTGLLCSIHERIENGAVLWRAETKT
jgi:hypothetical protein